MGIEIQVGKYYLMRNGGVVYITHQTVRLSLYAMVGYDARMAVGSWTTSGVYDLDNPACSFRIVEELATDDPRVAEFRALCALEG